jgi:NitT/TauT family transport system permease protein
MKTTIKSIGRQVIFYAAVIGAWAAVARLHIWPPYLFPAPKGVAESLWAGFADHSFWIAIAVSMKRMVIGYGVSVAIGMVLGLALQAASSWRKRWADC